MPVPRLFEAPPAQRERWAHVLATLVALTGPETRPALVTELAGEDLPGTVEAQAREAQPLGGFGADLVLRDRGKRWVLGLQVTLAFDADARAGVEGAYDVLADQADRAIVVAVTPDRKPPSAVGASRDGGRDVRHKSWLRVRDWVQERPERGGSTGADLLLLREAEYFLTPRVAELYRLEELMPHLPAVIRPALASIFFDLNDLSPAPLIATPSSGTDAARIAFPRTGDAAAEITIANGTLSVRLGGAVHDVTGPADWVEARSGALASAKGLLAGRG